MCVACFTDMKWFRGKIKEVKNLNKIHIYLVDHGTEKVFQWSHLRSLEPLFFKFDELAIKCILSNVPKITQNNLSNAIDFLNNCSKLWIPSKVEVVKRINHNSFEIVLFSLVDGKLVSVYQEFINRGYIQTVSSASGNTTTVNKSSKQEFTKILKKKNIDEEIKSTKTIVDDGKIYVKILLAKNPSEIYVRISSQKDELRSLFSEIQKFYNNSKPDLNVNWNVNDKCIMYSASLKQWHRGIVTKIDEDKNIAQVFLKDVARLEEGPISKLRKIAKEHLNVKDGAIKCCMTDICPAIGKNWPNITCEYLQEIINSNKQFYIYKDGPIANKSLPIKLWVLHLEAGGALEPCRETWKLVNNMIVEQGLAIRNYISNETVDLSVSSVEENTTIIEKNVMQKEIIINAPDMQKEIIISALNTEVKNDDFVNITDLIPKPIEHWLPANQLEKINFVGIPVQIDKDANIYVNIPEENENILTYVNLEIDKMYGESLPQPEDMFWSEGQPCIAQYPRNKKYYRATVNKILENNLIEVYFIDYGNIEQCHISTLRKKVITGSIPIQVQKFKIYGMEPYTGDTWDEEVLRYIDELLVGTECDITLLDKGDQNAMIIKLQIESRDFVDILASSKKAKNTKHTEINIPKLEEKKIEIIQESDSDIILDDNGEEISKVDVTNTSQSTHVNASKNKRLKKKKSKRNTDNENEINKTKMTVNNMDRKNSTSLTKLPNHSLPEAFLCRLIDVCTYDCGIIKLSFDNEFNQKLKLDYELLNKELNEFGGEQPVINDFSEGMHCIVQLKDNTWYRCTVLRIYKNDRNLLVRLVDEGTDKRMSFDDVRQIKESWLNIPPMSFYVTMRHIKIDDENIKSAAFLLRITASPSENYMIKIIRYNKDGMPVVDISNLKNNQV